MGWAGGFLIGGVLGVALCSSTNAGDRHDPHDFRDYKDVFNKGAAAAGGGDPEDPWNRSGEKKDCFRNPLDPKCRYVDAPYHHKNSKGWKSPSPKNGQKALDSSIPFKGTTSSRVAINEGEFVVLDRTSETPECVYHRHVREWKDLSQDMRNALIRQKWVNAKGKILKK